MQKPAASPLPNLIRSTGGAVLRIGISTIIVIEHAWPEIMASAAHLWKKTHWPLIDTVTNFGAPFPQVTTPALVLLTFSASIALATGLLTRVSSSVLLVLSLITYRWALSHGAAELSLLYIITFVSLVFFGGGHFSLDALFSIKKAEKNITAPGWKRG
ncbi:MAG: DoxX family protein [Verrucomicrobiales bacterium]|nr:DoxX family protein [Verrucomicrobiales bacterium]